MKKNEFKHPLFPVSTDYGKLWDLITEGHRIPGWIVYSQEYEQPIWDLVEVKFRNNQYNIGTRGIGYEGYQGINGFLMVCEMYSLHFVAPDDLKAVIT